MKRRLIIAVVLVAALLPLSLGYRYAYKQGYTDGKREANKVLEAQLISEINRGNIYEFQFGAVIINPAKIEIVRKQAKSSGVCNQCHDVIPEAING